MSKQPAAPRFPTFAPMPHTLLLDTAISDGAKCLWGIIHSLNWSHVPITMPNLVKATGRSQATVYRWATELKDQHYLHLERSKDGAYSFDLLYGPGFDPNAVPSVKDIQDQFLTGEKLEGDQFLTSEKLIPESPPEFLTSEKLILTSEKLQPIRSRPKASNRHPSDHDSYIPPPPDPHTPDNGGGGGGKTLITQQQPAPTATERWLLEEGVSRAKARQFAHLDLAAAQADWTKRMKAAAQTGRPIGAGAVLKAWEASPPTPAPAPPPRPVETDEERMRRVAEEIRAKSGRMTYAGTYRSS